MFNMQGEVGKRMSGIEILEDFDWGTHICSFYNSKNDLLDILVPYFKAGIASNEFCLWMTSDSATQLEAFNALHKEVPQLEQYIFDNKIEILSVGDGDMYEKTCCTHTLIDGWLDKLQSAEERGMNGMRIHDFISCNEMFTSDKIMEYESALRGRVADKRVIVLCTYPLHKCDAGTVIDIAHSHEYTITRREGKWEIVDLPRHDIKSKDNICDKKVQNTNRIKSEVKKESDGALSGDDDSDDTHSILKKVFTPSERHYREIFEKGSDGIFILDQATARIVDVNNKAVEITGYAKEELIDGHPGDFSSNNVAFSRRDAEHKINEALCSGDHLFEWEIRRKDGNTCWINVNISAAAIDGKQSILFFFHEIDVRKSVEQSLLQSESNYKYLFENNPASIYIWDPFALRVIEVNNTALEMYGYSRAEFLGMSTMNLRPEEDMSRYYEFLKFAQSDGDLSLRAGVWRHVKKDGGIIFVDITSHKIQYRGTQAVLSMNIDVTEKVLLEKRFEEERIKKQHEITDAVFFAEERERQEIGRELHDNVNQLLATARLYLGITKHDDPRFLQNIKEADHLVEIAINEIRNLSHAMISPMLEQSGLVNALKHLMDSIARGSDLRFEYNLDSIHEESMSDKLQLSVYRIVQEQLSNILKYAQASTVSVTLDQRGSCFSLIIKDNGIGFNREEKNNGIGLMNIHTRASLFNGFMHINTSAGQGCELVIDFTADA